MKKINIFLLVLSVALLLTASIDSAMAYFTTYTSAESKYYAISLGSKTTITEEVYDWTKHVVISNSAGSQPVYVRVKAFAGSTHSLSYSSQYDGDWSTTPDDEGYYYYYPILYPGSSTREFWIEIHDGLSSVDKFNVIVIYETTPVQYGEDGNPLDADWTLATQEGDTY